MTQVGTFTGGQVKTAKTQPLSFPDQPSGVQPVKDQVQSVGGAQGQAQTVNFVDGGPKGQQLRQLLNAKKFDDLATLSKDMSLKELRAANLTETEISAIADALGKGFPKCKTASDIFGIMYSFHPSS